MDSLAGDVAGCNGGGWSSSSSSSEFPRMVEPFDGSTERKRRSDDDSRGLALLPKKVKVEGDGSPSGVSEGITPELLAVQVVDEEVVLDAVPVSARPPAIEADKARIPRACKQFWKAGDYEGDGGISRTNNSDNMALCDVGMDHARIHPRFLHSNATSHKWALGAFAELLDNALDEVCNGATFVNIDVLHNRKDGSKMLVVEDNGGGMTPGKMRQCMSLGYSAKSKMANTIGQYGNGFKTSTMRLGADVLVLSRCQGANGKSGTQSIGMLSYTFLRATGKEDIMVPMIDFEKMGQCYTKMIRSSSSDWDMNLKTIVQWSPYMSEEDLIDQFKFLGHQGTMIVIYNLWEDDVGQLELDFDSDPYDIQLRGDVRNEKKIQMAQDYPFSRHFATYEYSLRSYASILYLKLPSNFRMTLRGKDIDHHRIENDMMHQEQFLYRPHIVPDISMQESDMVATVTVGFLKDARHHIDVQGFSVYNKNRLIKPFWRVWNAAGSNGRGVIGVLEANFVEPAHDKQGFERTALLSRLEQRLVKMQKDYWSQNSHKIGYAKKPSFKNPYTGVKHTPSSTEQKTSSWPNQNAPCSINGDSTLYKREPERQACFGSTAVAKSHDTTPARSELNKENDQMGSFQNANVIASNERYLNGSVLKLIKEKRVLEEENLVLKERFNKMGPELQYKADKCRSLELQVKDLEIKIQDLGKENETVIEMLAEERKSREEEENRLKKKIREASNIIDDLVNKVRLLESKGTAGYKVEG